ncbi:MAG: helix-turn-helix transcriptional regulator [Treponema sp.]|jgi:DNA-binding XRE family transcriptional regulator|nr:helix-turn-helix transcriptional regulator [Treponema sp.]
MERLGEILAKNMKKYRRKCGISQAQLAENVDVSTHHIGMIELARNFPTLDLVERIANALDIEIYQLFLEPHSPNEELEQLRQEIRDDMKQLLNDFLEKNLSGKCMD